MKKISFTFKRSISLELRKNKKTSKHKPSLSYVQCPILIQSIILQTSISHIVIADFMFPKKLTGIFKENASIRSSVWKICMLNIDRTDSIVARLNKLDEIRLETNYIRNIIWLKRFLKIKLLCIKLMKNESRQEFSGKSWLYLQSSKVNLKRLKNSNWMKYRL